VSWESAAKRTSDVGHTAGIGCEASVWREVIVGCEASVRHVGCVAGIGRVADVGHVGGWVPCAYCACMPACGRHVAGVGCDFMLQALAGVCVTLWGGR
jgi:hypothetical protein